jgi:hypothetical protein
MTPLHSLSLYIACHRETPDHELDTNRPIGGWRSRTDRSEERREFCVCFVAWEWNDRSGDHRAGRFWGSGFGESSAAFLSGWICDKFSPRYGGAGVRIVACRVSSDRAICCCGNKMDFWSSAAPCIKPVSFSTSCCTFLAKNPLNRCHNLCRSLLLDKSGYIFHHGVATLSRGTATSSHAKPSSLSI